MTNLTDPDDSYMVFDAANSGVGPHVQATFEGIVQMANPAEMTISFECQATVPGVQQKIEVYDGLAGQWELFDIREATITDSKVHFVIKDDPWRYMTSNIQSRQVFKVRMSWTGPTTGTWQTKIDYLKAIAIEP